MESGTLGATGGCATVTVTLCGTRSRRAVSLLMCAREERGMKIHPGIRIDRIPVEGWVGLLWGTVIMVRTIIELPDARWFFPASIAGGVAVAVALHFWRTRRT